MKTSQKLGLIRSATYQIKVPGHLDQSWSDWADEDSEFTIAVVEEDGLPISILTDPLVQAALQGLLRRQYSPGLPVISVICVDCS